MGVPWIEIKTHAAELADTGFEEEANIILAMVDDGIKGMTPTGSYRHIRAMQCGVILEVASNINTSTAREIIRAVAENLKGL